MKRIVGMAYAGPDGAIYWQGVDNVDTANCEPGQLLVGNKLLCVLGSGLRESAACDLTLAT